MPDTSAAFGADAVSIEEITDYVLMMKIDEQNMQGGNSLLLHLDDWEHLDNYFRHPLARRPMRFAAPPSKNVSIRQAIQDESFNGQIDASIAQLRKDFMHPEFKALLETVGPHGEFIALPI